MTWEFLHDNPENRSPTLRKYILFCFCFFVVSSRRPTYTYRASCCAVLPASSLFATLLSRLATIFLQRVATKSPPSRPPYLFPGRFLPFFLFFPPFSFFLSFGERQSNFLNPISRIPLSPPLFSIFFYFFFTVSKTV